MLWAVTCRPGCRTATAGASRCGTSTIPPSPSTCPWFAFAFVPRLGLTVIERTFKQLARDYDGIAPDPE